MGAQLRENAAGLEANGVALVIGVLVSLWSGLAVVRHAQDALNLQWGVPRFRRPGFVSRGVRAFGVLAVVGLGILLATAATTLITLHPQLAGPTRILGTVLAIAVNIVVLTVSYRVLIQERIAWRALVPGGLVGGFGLWALQVAGSEYVARVVLDATDVYGAFAVMFGLLVWIALLARVTLVASEINVVRARGLWPRSFSGSEPTEADRRAVEDAMQREALLAGARVQVDVSPPPDGQADISA